MNFAAIRKRMQANPPAVQPEPPDEVEPGISLKEQLAHARRMPQSPTTAAIVQTLERCVLLEEVSLEMRGIK